MKFKHVDSSGGRMGYLLGFVGALFYFISHATTFGMGVLGFIKAVVWPAILVFKLLEFLRL